MTRFPKQLFSPFLIAALLASAAFAKEDPHEMLAKTFQQGTIWQQGPVKLVGKVRMPGPNGQDLNLDYTVSWASPEKWRAEWSAPGLSQITVLNNGKLSYVTNQPSGQPLVRGLQFEDALAALDGGNPAGPYAIPPIDYAKIKFDVSKKKVNNVDAKCLASTQPNVNLCIDPATGHVLSADGDVGSFEFSDYATAGPTAYPQTIKVNYAKTLMEDAKVTVTRGDKFDDALFTPPDKSTTIDFHTCADVDKNFTAPHLSKSVPPKMTDAARKAKKYGIVWTLATVGKDGSVQKVDILGGDPDLNQSAKDAVQQYKFTPYMRCGEAVVFEQVIVVAFTPPAAIPQL